MSIINGYSGCDRKSISSLSHEELIDAVTRMFLVPIHEFDPSDSWNGGFILPDELADAFRNRL